MTDPPSHLDSNGDTGGGGGPTTPRWVYGFGLIAVVLVLLFVILHLTGGGFGDHTPRVPQP